MKKMKKMMALVIAVVMMMAMSMTTMAARTGSITIDNATKEKTYKIYKVFALESVAVDEDDKPISYKYKIEVAWENFFKDATYFKATYKLSESIYNDHFKDKINSEGYLVGFTDSMNAEQKAGLAQAMLDYAENKKIEATETLTANSAEVKFENIANGYYLVDSNLGTLCSLDTVNGDVTIREKNTQITIAKAVKEDSTNKWESTATADFGQEVEYKLTVTIGNLGEKIAGDIVIIDQLPKGIDVIYSDENDSLVIDDGIQESSWEKGKDYTVTYDDDKLTITLKNGEDLKLNSVSNNSTLNITYKATVGNDAIVGTEGNTNTAYLTYNGSPTANTTAKVCVYGIDVFKYTGENNPLANAKFKLYKMVGETKKYVTVSDGIVTGWDENGSDLVSSSVESTLGKISIDGLDADTYFLEETEAPSGYNKLTAPIKVVISETGTVTYNGTDASTTDNQVKIENKTGGLLPETGGIGTTIFYVAGAIMVVGAAVVLVTRKRMENQ